MKLTREHACVSLFYNDSLLGGVPGSLKARAEKKKYKAKISITENKQEREEFCL